MQEEKAPKFTSRPEIGRLFEPCDRWVLINVVVEYTGYSDDAVRAKVKRGDWPYRTFWRKAPDGHVVFNLSQIQRWMSCNVS